MEIAKVWRWADAPQQYKNLSEHGGDENWVVWIHADSQANFPLMAYRDYVQGWGHVNCHGLANGHYVIIFAHASAVGACSRYRGINDA